MIQALFFPILKEKESRETTKDKKNIFLKTEKLRFVAHKTAFFVKKIKNLFFCQKIINRVFLGVRPF